MVDAKPEDARSRRLGRSKLLRGAAAVLLLPAALWSSGQSLANVVARSSPALAHTMAPVNGAITARLAAVEFLQRPSTEPDTQAALLARRALLQDATAAEALVVLGFQAQLRGKQALSDRAFDYANTLSRREVRAQIWAIENAVGQGDIASALRFYDVALRTSGEAQGMLVPTLTAALAEPKVRTALLPILATKPVWAPAFFSFAVRDGRNPDGVIRLLDEGRSTGLEIPDEDQTALLDMLVSAGEADLAWRYYTHLQPGSSRTQSRDPAFGALGGLSTALDWTAGDIPNVFVQIVREGRAGHVELDVEPSGSGVLLRQAQLLPIGRYNLRAVMSGLDASAAARFHWSLTCADRRELGRISLELRPSGEALSLGIFTVPQGCPVQQLSLVVRSFGQRGGVAGRVEQVQLAPAP